MTEVIVFPDVEAVVISYVKAELVSRGNTANVGTKPPASKSAPFVVIRRTGGPRRDLVIDQAQLTVEAWAEKAVDAMTLMQLVRGLIHAIDQVTYAGSTYQFYAPQEFSGPANLPDPDSSWERYTETFSVGVRGSAV